MTVPWRRISFEFFPPKTFEGMNKLINAAKSLGVFSPAFFSVTFGAGGSTRERTIETVLNLNDKLAVPITPHIACVGFDRNELVNILEQYKKMGVNRLVVLRGDYPSGMVSPGDFEYAADFVKMIRVMYEDQFHIEVGAYPECHPQAKSWSADIQNLKDKIQAGADSAITQYFFNSDAYFYFMEDCQRQGVDIPVYPGVMPIYNLERLMRFSNVCGAEVPRWVQHKVASYEGDDASQRAFAVEFIGKHCERLLAGGAPGLHFYTLNRADFCLELLKYIAPFEAVYLPQDAHAESTASK